MFSTWPSVRPSFLPSVRPSVRALNHFDANWHKWSVGQRDETIHFWSQKVKYQGHTMSKLDLETWWRSGAASSSSPPGEQVYEFKTISFY